MDFFGLGSNKKHGGQQQKGRIKADTAEAFMAAEEHHETVDDLIDLGLSDDLCHDEKAALLEAKRVRSGGSVVNWWKAKMGYAPADLSRRPSSGAIIRRRFQQKYQQPAGTASTTINQDMVEYFDDNPRDKGGERFRASAVGVVDPAMTPPAGVFGGRRSLQLGDDAVGNEGEGYVEHEYGGGGGGGEGMEEEEGEEDDYGEGEDDLFGRKKKIIGYTIDDALNYIGFGSYQLMMTLIAGLGWMAYAMTIMMMPILNSELQCAWRVTPWKLAALTTSPFVGMAMSSFFWGFMGDKFGRRRACVAASWLLVYECGLCAFAPSFGWLVFLRWMVGFSLGVMPQLMTLYAEIMPPKYRGWLVTSMHAFWVLGCALNVIIAVGVVPNFTWRTFVLLSALGPCAFALTVGLMPESPRYLLSCSKDLALEILHNIAKANNMVLDLPGKFLFDVEPLRERANFCRLFSPILRWTTLPLSFVWFTAMLCYYGTVLMTTGLFRMEHGACQETKRNNFLDYWKQPSCGSSCRHVSRVDYWEMLFTALAELIGMAFSLYFVQRWGRKWTIGLELGFFAFVISLQFTCISDIVQLAILTFTARALSGAALHTLHLFTPETFPAHLRSVAFGICYVAAAKGAILSPLIAQAVLRSSPFVTFGILAGTALVACFLVLNLPLETMECSMPEKIDFECGKMWIGGEEQPCDYLYWCPKDNTELIQAITDPCRPRPDPKNPCEIPFKGENSESESEKETKVKAKKKCKPKVKK